jgi:AraC family transcriptional regulator of arabinose operon
MILWIVSRLRGMLIPDGFPGQRLRVLPRPLVRTALSSAVTARLLVTDAGHFPHAAAHGRWRPTGAEEAIVILCVEGAGRLQLADRMLSVAAGQAVVIPSGVGHRYWADEHNPWSIWWLHATGSDVPDLVSAIVGEDEQLIVSVRDMFTAVDLVEQAVTNLEQDETTASLYLAAGVTWNLLAQLASDRLRGSASSTDRIQLVQDYLRQHLATPTDVGELARLAGLSTSHFSALFKASAGIGVVEYVKRLRGARARELLITTNASIADIARAVGYSDAFYFSRQFRAINGTSPSEYRANHHGLRT